MSAETLHTLDGKPAPHSFLVNFPTLVNMQATKEAR